MSAVKIYCFTSFIQIVTSHMNLGAMYHFNGKLADAEKSYLEALRLKPDDEVTTENLRKLRNLIHRNGNG